MGQIQYVKDAILKKGKNPSEWINEPEYIPITEIKMTCGGKVWSEYVHRVYQIPSNTIMKFKRYDGKMITLNTSYIVSAEDFTLAIAELDITEWSEKNNCFSYGDSEKYYRIIDDNKKLVLV